LSRFVLDCSITMAWCFEDESTRLSDDILDSFNTSSALVPSIWPLEVANVLLVAERQKRLTEADSARFITLLQTLPIETDPSSSHQIFGNSLALAREQHLSSYDAAYLELAMREGVALVTLDKKLKKTATKLGVSVL